MRNRQYVGDNKQRKAEQFARKTVESYVMLGFPVTDREIKALARWLFPDAYKTLNYKLFADLDCCEKE